MEFEAKYIWANPFNLLKGEAPGSSLAKYEQYVRKNPFLMQWIPLLAGKTLGCWCKPKPCHGDVLVKLVEEFFDKEKLPDTNGEEKFDEETGVHGKADV